MRVKRMLGELVRFGPHRGAHRAAARCAVSVGAPMALLVMLGRVDLLGAAAFGAFTAIYARELAAPARTLVQAVTALGLVGSVGVGLAAAHLPGSPWTQLIVLVVVAGVMTLLGGIVAWKPPGALFFVFAAGTYAAAPAQDAPAAAQTVMVAAASAAFSVAVGSIGALRTGAGRQRRVLAVESARAVWTTGVVADVVLASASAGIVAIVVGVEHIAWALVAAVVVASVSHRGAWAVRGAQRALGTLVGLVLAAPLLLLDAPVWLLVLVAIACQFCAELFVLRNYGLALVFVTPLALILSNLAFPMPASELLVDRLVSTVLGVVVSAIVLALRAQPWRVARNA